MATIITTTLTPSVDGYTNETIANSTWATLVAAAGDFADYDEVDPGFPCENAYFGYVCAAGSNLFTHLRRPILIFNLSTLDLSIPITAATLNLWIAGHQVNITPTDISIAIYQASPASSNELVAGDFDSFSAIPLSDSINLDDFDSDANLAFTFNAAGLVLLASGGIVSIGLRYDKDVSATVPPWSSLASEWSWFSTTANTRGYAIPDLVVTQTQTAVTYEPRFRGGGVTVNPESMASAMRAIKNWEHPIARMRRIRRGR